MRIGFVGAGKVGTAFGRYLFSKGQTVSGYLDRHAEKMDHAGHHTHSRPFQRMADIATHSDIILITTRDDQIAAACHQLCEQMQLESRHLVGHMSGAHSSRILIEAQKRGAVVFSLHPLQAFSDEEKALADLPKTYFSVEGDGKDLDPIFHLLSQTGNPYFTLAPEHKSLYHLSACVFSNYLVTLMAAGMSALNKAGIDPQEGLAAMRPLIEGTLANIEQLGPAHALTGPIARGDVGTIETHMAALPTPGVDSLTSIYTFMGLETLELATQQILKNTEKASALRQLLSKK